jgi:radical SAM/Cys-rich protein
MIFRSNAVTAALLLTVPTTTLAWMSPTASSWCGSTGSSTTRLWVTGTTTPTTGTGSGSTNSNNEEEEEEKEVDLPDFNTPVQVDQIKLSSPRTTPSTATASSSSSQWRRPDLFGSSLVDQTLQELQEDVNFQSTLERIRKVGLTGITKEERALRRRALTNLGIPSFAKFLSDQMTEHDIPEVTITSNNNKSPSKVYSLKRSKTKILQINIGLYCNQACGHCHVESSPLRKDESMSAEIAAKCLKILKQSPSVTTLDITGGAPELNPHFRTLVSMARAMNPDLEIIDRCNLTVLQEPGQEDLIDFLKQHKVHIIASLPCYSAENVNAQRGSGVFERSIAALLALNDAGYGTLKDPSLKLDLVYNPLGAFLPPPQEKLQGQYKIQLEENFGILFNSLFTITNMPIKRFADFLHRRGELQDYMSLLVRNFNKNTVENLMCRDTVSVGWDGQVRTSRMVCCYDDSPKM